MHSSNFSTKTFICLHIYKITYYIILTGTFDVSVVLQSSEIKEIMSFLPLETYCPGFVLLAYFVLAYILLLFCKTAYEKMYNFKPTAVRLGVCLFLLIWSVFSFAGISTFLSFNFEDDR